MHVLLTQLCFLPSIKYLECNLNLHKTPLQNHACYWIMLLPTLMPFYVTIPAKRYSTSTLTQHTISCQKPVVSIQDTYTSGIVQVTGLINQHQGAMVQSSRHIEQFATLSLQKLKQKPPEHLIMLKME